MSHRKPKTTIRKFRRGVSLVELLLSLAITAMLLTATMVATDVSFKAYASSAEQASAQAGSRMVTNRLLTLIRTSTAHGPMGADTSVTPAATVSGNTIVSPYIELLDSSGNIVRVEHRPASNELWMIRTPPGGTAVEQPIMGGVTAAKFNLIRRKDKNNLWVLDRGTLDMTVTPGADATLTLEHGGPASIRVIASTMPRRLE